MRTIRTNAAVRDIVHHAIDRLIDHGASMERRNCGLPCAASVQVQHDNQIRDDMRRLFAREIDQIVARWETIERSIHPNATKFDMLADVNAEMESIVREVEKQLCIELEVKLPRAGRAPKVSMKRLWERLVGERVRTLIIKDGYTGGPN